MKKFLNCAFLVLLPFLGLACMAAPKHGMDIKSGQGEIGKYDSIHQYGSAGGRVLNQLSLTGQFHNGTVTESEEDVIAPGTQTASAPPTRPVYGRAAKAVPREVKVVIPPKTIKLKRKTVVTPGGQLLASVGEGGPTTAHDVQVGLAYSVPAAAGFVGGNAVAPGTKINLTQQGAKILNSAINDNKISQGQWASLSAAQQMEVLNNLASSSSSSAGAAAVAGK